ncbi:MAG: alkaline phosphatase family protein [Chloroflexota bacterium]|nr:alkaline phosphatase family protein [Chloroflexota bacterium]
MKWQSPVVMIGIDAATWDVMGPLLAAGKVPNIERLVVDGAAGELRSMVQYVSPALWTTVMTGQVPERHGVMDFYSGTRLHRRSPALPEIIGSEAGKVGLFRWFASWPPMANNGFTVPCSVARSPETYPADLQFLNDLVYHGGFRIYLKCGIKLLQYGTSLKTVLKAAGELVHERMTRAPFLDWWYRRRLLETAIYGDVFAHLLRRYRPDFAAILLYHTDDLSHRYWKYREAERFDDVTPSEINKYGRVIDDAYIAADEAVGKIVGVLPEDSLIIVLSDHGQEAGPPVATPYRMTRSVLRLLGFQDRVWLTYVGYSAFIRARIVGEASQALTELKDALEKVRLQPNQRPVFDVSVENGPQLVVDVNVDTQVALDSMVSLPGAECVPLEVTVFTDGRLSGTHSEQGILIVKGPGVRKGQNIEKASILDIAPTVLALRGIPVSREMDGRVLTGIITESYLAQNPIQYVDSHGSKSSDDEVEVPFAADELEVLENRLRHLGYLS